MKKKKRTEVVPTYESMLGEKIFSIFYTRQITLKIYNKMEDFTQPSPRKMRMFLIESESRPREIQPSLIFSNDRGSIDPFKGIPLRTMGTKNNFCRIRIFKRFTSFDEDIRITFLLIPSIPKRNSMAKKDAFVGVPCNFEITMSEVGFKKFQSVIQKRKKLFKYFVIEEVTKKEKKNNSKIEIIEARKVNEKRTVEMNDKIIDRFIQKHIENNNDNDGSEKEQKKKISKENEQKKKSTLISSKMKSTKSEMSKKFIGSSTASFYKHNSRKWKCCDIQSWLNCLYIDNPHVFSKTKISLNDFVLLNSIKRICKKKKKKFLESFQMEFKKSQMSSPFVYMKAIVNDYVDNKRGFLYEILGDEGNKIIERIRNVIKEMEVKCDIFDEKKLCVISKRLKSEIQKWNNAKNEKDNNNIANISIQNIHDEVNKNKHLYSIKSCLNLFMFYLLHDYKTIEQFKRQYLEIFMCLKYVINELRKERYFIEEILTDEKKFKKFVNEHVKKNKILSRDKKKEIVEFLTLIVHNSYSLNFERGEFNAKIIKNEYLHSYILAATLFEQMYGFSIHLLVEDVYVQWKFIKDGRKGQINENDKKKYRRNFYDLDGIKMISPYECGIDKFNNVMLKKLRTRDLQIGVKLIVSKIKNFAPNLLKRMYSSLHDFVFHMLNKMDMNTGLLTRSYLLFKKVKINWCEEGLVNISEVFGNDMLQETKKYEELIAVETESPIRCVGKDLEKNLLIIAQVIVKWNVTMCFNGLGSIPLFGKGHNAHEFCFHLLNELGINSFHNEVEKYFKDLLGKGKSGYYNCTLKIRKEFKKEFGSIIKQYFTHNKDLHDITSIDFTESSIIKSFYKQIKRKLLNKKFHFEEKFFRTHIKAFNKSEYCKVFVFSNTFYENYKEAFMNKLLDTSIHINHGKIYFNSHEELDIFIKGMHDLCDGKDEFKLQLRGLHVLLKGFCRAFELYNRKYDRKCKLNCPNNIVKVIEREDSKRRFYIHLLAKKTFKVYVKNLNMMYLITVKTPVGFLKRISEIVNVSEERLIISERKAPDCDVDWDDVFEEKDMELIVSWKEIKKDSKKKNVKKKKKKKNDVKGKKEEESNIDPLIMNLLDKNKLLQIRHNFAGLTFKELRRFEKEDFKGIIPINDRFKARFSKFFRMLKRGKKVKKFAFVVGNADYEEFPKLNNPINDAKAMSRLFKSLGFIVSYLPDADADEFHLNLNLFVQSVIDEVKEDKNINPLIVFYYSGHGVFSSNEDIFLPVDFKRSLFEVKGDESKFDGKNITSIDNVGSLLLNKVKKVRTQIFKNCITETSIRTLFESISMYCNNPVKFAFFLDCCRNPINLKYKCSPIKGNKFRSIGGLYVISYSTMRGKFANDDWKINDMWSGNHSPYTSSLLRRLKEVGDLHDILFKKVMKDVQKKTKNNQTPVVSATTKIWWN